MPEVAGVRSTSMTLAGALGLRPLDRLQINDQRQIAEMTYWRRQYGAAELPFLYFQRVLPDGQLEVRGPGGYVTTVSAYDVCDARRGEPLVVRAMPESVFRARLALPVSERGAVASDECYSPADVLYAQKDRWGNVDVFVWFHDPALNTTCRPWRAPLHRDDVCAVRQAARRTRMPVMDARRAGNASADSGCASEVRYETAVVYSWFASALRGDLEGARLLASAGLKRVPRAALSRRAPATA